MLYARVGERSCNFQINQKHFSTLASRTGDGVVSRQVYPIITSLPSCIKLPEANENNFELKPQFINTLPKFHSLESEEAYFFVREFEEVCLMISIPQLGDDAIRLRFIPFSLKDLAKKWLYSLAVDSVTTWDDFIKAFLKNFYPIHKTALIRKNIMQFR